MSELSSIISSEVNRRSDMILGLIQELVRIPTYVPPGLNYDRIAEIPIPYLLEAGFDVRKVTMPEETVSQYIRCHHPEVSGPRVNVLATKHVADNARAILWNAHLDTVPYDADEWTHDPLGGVIHEGRIWGRGVADDKGEAACIVAAFWILHELGIELTCNPTIALACDEEIGPYSGLMYLADLGYFDNIDLFHGCDGNGDGIYVAFNGALFWRIDVRGKSAHSSTPSLGINAIERSVSVLYELLKFKEKVEARVSSLASSPNGKAVRPVFNITMVKGGLAQNLIPADLILEGDRRFLPEESEEEVISEIEMMVSHAAELEPELNISLSITPFYTSWSTDPDSSWVRETQGVAEQALGRPLSVYASPGSCDVSYVANSKQIPTVCFGLGRVGESNTHGADENARVDDVLGLVKTICLLATAS